MDDLVLARRLFATTLVVGLVPWAALLFLLGGPELWLPLAVVLTVVVLVNAVAGAALLRDSAPAPRVGAVLAWLLVGPGSAWFLHVTLPRFLKALFSTV